MMGATAKPKKNNANGVGSEASIDPAAQLHEIQKLLFGQQISQLESVISDMKSDMASKLTQLEKTFKQSLDKQREDLSLQLSDLSTFLNEVDGQHQNREALIEDDLDALRKSLDQFEAQTESAHDSLEKQLLSESKKLSDDLNAKHTETLAKLKTNTTTLDDNKVDRASLAELLSNVAKTIQPGA